MHVVEIEFGCLERSGRGRAEFLNERIDNAPTPECSEIAHAVGSTPSAQRFRRTEGTPDKTGGDLCEVGVWVKPLLPHTVRDVIGKFGSIAA